MLVSKLISVEIFFQAEVTISKQILSRKRVKMQWHREEHNEKRMHQYRASVATTTSKQRGALNLP